MELASAAMTPLMEKLGQLLVSELTLEKRVRKDVASLHTELKAMHLALQRVQVPPDRLDAGTARWAADVRELSYDMEDAIDAFTLLVEDPADDRLRSRLRAFLDRTARLFTKGKALHQVAGTVREAKELAKQLAEIHQRYAGLKPQDASGTGGAAARDIDPRVTAMYTEAADLVGVDGARDELIKVLSSDPSEVEVKTVSIVGFGGLGKTTLAKAVYDKIKLQFDRGAFVSVSRNPDITRVFQLILFELDKERYANIKDTFWDMNQLIDELRGFLQDKRYLIVIDDLWDEKCWGFIKCAFPKNTCSSRLITTSRIRNVSEKTCSSGGDKIYEIKPLSEDDSLKLFHSRIFHRGNTCPPELEQVSRDILKKCGGVPLAVITIASFLAGHRPVKPKDQWHVLLNSIGHGLTDGANNILGKILSLSYYDLPSHLKPCLLYLSIFPEDYDIERDRLIWRWIAEGFIQHRNTSGHDTLFEIGESYFIELVNRSMIQPVAIDLEGRAQACRVHDIVLDLIRSLSSKENFVTVCDDEEDEQTRSSHNNSIARRLSIIQNTRQATTTSMSKVRSFTIFNPAINSMPPLSEFQVIRVLDLEGCDLSKCDSSRLNLKHLGKLCHLRYLGLRRTGIRELPVEVGKLKFLQTLDVRGSNGVRELPATIIGLRNLMRLRLAWETKLPNGLGNLTSLEDLTGLRISGDDSATIVRELRNLTGLRLLTVSWKAADLGEALIQSLGNLRNLQSLDVYADGGRGNLLTTWAPPPRLRRFLSRGPTSAMPTLPAWMKNGSSSLTFLDIWVDQVGPGDLQALGALPSLRGVRLRERGRIDAVHSPARMVVNAGAFPCARACTFLHFVTTPSMFRAGAMPLVQRLEFSFRAWDVAESGGGGRFGLEDLRMEHLPSLEEVHVELWYRKEEDATVVERVEAALRQAAVDHPNRLALRINKRISRRQAKRSGSTPVDGFGASEHA